MKKVLIITYSWPPSNSIAVHRILRLGRWLTTYGWEPHIITSKYSLDVRIDYNNVEFANKYFKNVYKSGSVISYCLVKLFLSRNIIKMALTVILRRLFIPDLFIHWLFSGARDGLEIVRKNNIDAIWATLNPYSSGLMAAYISKKTGVPLLIDYRDPWTLNRFHKLGIFKQRINKFLEKKMLKQASAICTTSKPMSDLFVNSNYFKKEMVYTVTNSVDEDLQHKNLWNTVNTLLCEDKFNITHIGSFYGDRQPYDFIKALALIVGMVPDLRKKIKVNFLGNSNNEHIINFCKEHYVDDLFLIGEHISYKEAMNTLSHSDLLLLVNGVAKNNEIFIPGKLFDYIAVKKPILFIGKGQPAEIISELMIGESTDHNANEIAKKLLKMIQTIKTYYVDEKELEKYKSMHISKKITDIFQNIKY